MFGNRLCEFYYSATETGENLDFVNLCFRKIVFIYNSIFNPTLNPLASWDSTSTSSLHTHCNEEQLFSEHKFHALPVIFVRLAKKKEAKNEGLITTVLVKKFTNLPFLNIDDSMINVLTKSRFLEDTALWQHHALISNLGTITANRSITNSMYICPKCHQFFHTTLSFSL